MQGYKQVIKDKLVRFFSEVTEWVDGEERVVRVYWGYKTSNVGCSTYPYKLDHFAYIRQLSANEKFSASAMQDDSDLEVTMNYRPVMQDMLMEFCGKIYKIGPVDNLEFNKTEIKLRAKEVTPQNYQKIEIKEWSQ